MNTFAFKISFLGLLVTLMGCADAIEQYNENQASWWDKTKQSVVNLWDSSISTSSTEESIIPAEKGALFGQIWDKITPKLDHVLALEKEHEKLPESAWIGKDKRENRLDINQLLDEAVDILSLSNSAQTRTRISSLEDEIQQLKQTISEHRQAKVSAPVQSQWKMTVAEYEEKIQQLNQTIRQRKAEIDTLKTQFAQELADNGLHLTEEQLDVLLSSIVGDDIIQSSIVYDNVKQISQQLMKLTIESGEQLKISQRYYGMYTVLLKILLHMQQGFINNIGEKYLPKIDQIVANVQDITATTQNLLRGEHEKNRRQHLLANLEAQKLTLQTAEVYEKHLIGQRRKVILARDKTYADLQIAQNTYKTVRVSGELITLLRSSQKSFEMLLNIQVPDLLVFENVQMKQEFAILTEKLAE